MRQLLISLVLLSAIFSAQGQKVLKFETFKWDSDSLLWLYDVNGDSIKIEFVTGQGHHIWGSYRPDLFALFSRQPDSTDNTQRPSTNNRLVDSLKKVIARLTDDNENLLWQLGAAKRGIDPRMDQTNHQ